MLNYLFYPEGRIRTGSRIDDFHDTIASYFLDAWSPTASSLVLSFLNLFFSKWSHSIFVAFWDLVSSWGLIVQWVPTVNFIQFQKEVKSTDSYTLSPGTTPPSLPVSFFLFNGNTMIRLWKGITNRLICVIPFLQVFREQYSLSALYIRKLLVTLFLSIGERLLVGVERSCMS